MTPSRCLSSSAVAVSSNFLAEWSLCSPRQVVPPFAGHVARCSTLPLSGQWATALQAHAFATCCSQLIAAASSACPEKNTQSAATYCAFFWGQADEAAAVNWLQHAAKAWACKAVDPWPLDGSVPTLAMWPGTLPAEGGTTWRGEREGMLPAAGRCKGLPARAAAGGAVQCFPGTGSGVPGRGRAGGRAVLLRFIGWLRRRLEEQGCSPPQGSARCRW